MNLNSKILILGGSGMLGSQIIEQLQKQGYNNIHNPSRSEVELVYQEEVNQFFNFYKPEYVFLCAAKVGGIMANKSQPAEFGYVNGMIALNVLEAAKVHKAKKLLYLGSSCIYPKGIERHMVESDLLTGQPEQTNEMYALSKILGLKLCSAYRDQYDCNFISCMPCNLYGPGDNFDPNKSHVIPALIKKFHEAKLSGSSSVVCFGDGTPKREFLHVRDCAEACIFLMKEYNEREHINVGTGKDLQIKDLVYLIKSIIGYEGDILWDTSKPNGTMRKVVSTNKINKLGWEAKIDLETGLEETYKWMKENI